MKNRSANVIRNVMVGAALAAAPAFALAGTGPYLGLEAGGNWVNGETFRNDGSGAAPYKFDNDVFGYMGGLVGGYSFANGLRPELELSFRRNEKRQGGWDNAPTAMANLWYDFSLPAAWHVPALHPYVGGGVGFGRIDPSVNQYQSGPGRTAMGYRSVLVYQGGVGLDYAITDRVTAGVGYRWMQSSTTAFEGRGTFNGVGRYRANTALVSVRYSFGSQAAPVAPAPPPAPVAEAAQAAPPAATVESPNRKFENVNFAFDKSNLTNYAQASLNGDAKTINKLAEQYPDLQVDVSGNTDWVGTAAYNQALSERRANAVRDYLQAQGVEGKRIHTFAYGETQPIAPNTTAEGRAQNRRAEIRSHSVSVSVNTGSAK